VTGPRREISAMIRVRNEEEYLEASVRSVAEHVDEIVIVDNRSEDRTPEIIGRLRNELRNAIAVYEYPHRILRVGRETWEKAGEPGSEGAPSLSSSYYNWCLEKCTRPFVLKWDGDMIALPALGGMLDEWRSSGKNVLVFHGANVHPNGENLVMARSADREKLLSRLSVPALPKWATSLTYDYPEPRLFPRESTRYTNRIRWTQELFVPAYNGEPEERSVLLSEKPGYLHMKFCKMDPMSNYTEDLGAVIAGNVTVGPPMKAEWKSTLEGWLGRGGESRS